MRARLGVGVIETVADFGILATGGATIIVERHTALFIPKLAVRVNDCQRNLEVGKRAFVVLDEPFEMDESVAKHAFKFAAILP